MYLIVCGRNLRLCRRTQTSGTAALFYRDESVLGGHKGKNPHSIAEQPYMQTCLAKTRAGVRFGS